MAGWETFRNANGVGQQLAESSVPVVLASDKSLSIVAGTAPATSLTTYLAAGNMAASVPGGAIAVGPEGRLALSVKWVNTNAPIGVLVLQTLSLIDGVTWVDIPGSSGGFGQHPNNDTAETIGYFRELQPFTSVRLFYRYTSGGANTTLTAGYRVQ